ncbi:MAG: hypothetical protein M1827_000906 [Pycnora praestabilis]|nr:MAG: hypothetical protein M1827_000906 [Pycnora praestabilis]
MKLTLPFTASPLQATTYLFAVCLFSISFLVFLNASVSFVITDLIKSHDRVGDAVGTLGFADELLALVACPAWGILSDRIGVRTVCVLGYAIVGLALLVFVQAKNVYPQLMLARLFFSIGGAAMFVPESLRAKADQNSKNHANLSSSTMVTAILPSMTAPSSSECIAKRPAPSSHTTSPSESSEITVTPSRLRSESPKHPDAGPPKSNSSPPRMAGYVGMFTGCGALVALGIFLPLPDRFQAAGISPGQAVADSYYVVGSVAFLVSILCFFGLRNLKGEERKGWRSLVNGRHEELDGLHEDSTIPYWKLFLESTSLGFRDVNIGLGYLGGFVARASSVGISLFIPLYVNAYFISSGLCTADPSGDTEEMKRQCRRAYLLAAELTGVSQLIALLFAPFFGYISDRYRRFNVPLLVAAGFGIIGYLSFASLESPEPSGDHGNPAIFFIVALLGLSQIGAIVCSLGQLGRGVLGQEGGYNLPTQLQDQESSSGQQEPLNISRPSDCHESSPLRIAHTPSETTTLLPSATETKASETRSLNHLKGSIAGVYSLAGGAGILLLTKLGGFLFDDVSHGAPFYMLSIFNAILLVIGIGCGISEELVKRRDSIQVQH